jgi:hypothetical protein
MERNLNSGIIVAINRPTLFPDLLRDKNVHLNGMKRKNEQRSDHKNDPSWIKKNNRKSKEDLNTVYQVADYVSQHFKLHLSKSSSKLSPELFPAVWSTSK